MSGATANERAALAQVMAADAEETTRQTIWGLVPTDMRRRAVIASQLPPVMAAYTLDQFTAEQRRLIGATMSRQAHAIDMIQRAMGIGTQEAADRRAARDARRLAELEAWAAEEHPSRSNLAH